MGLRSVRTDEHLLRKWNSCLVHEEKEMLADYNKGRVEPSEKDRFPDLTLSPKLEDCTCYFLKCENTTNMNFHNTTGKMLYRACVEVFNERNLNGRVELIHPGAQSPA